MQPEIHHANNNDAKEAKSPELATSLSAPKRLGRRSFLRNLGLGATVLVPGAALLSGSSKALAANGRQRLTRGDVAILQLLAAAELIEADLWQQYKELGGVDAPDSGYKTGLLILDGDQPQYIADNTDDELSHAAFLNAYLASKGEQQVDLGSSPTCHPAKSRSSRKLDDLRTLSSSLWTPAGGPGIAALPTLISARRFETQCRVCILDYTQQFLEAMPCSGTRTTRVIMLRRSLSRPDFTLVILNKVARASTRRWLRK